MCSLFAEEAQLWSGRAAGSLIALWGFAAIGPPLMGLSADVWGTCVPGWLATAFLLALSAVASFKVPPGSTIGG